MQKKKKREEQKKKRKPGIGKWKIQLMEGGMQRVKGDSKDSRQATLLITFYYNVLVGVIFMVLLCSTDFFTASSPRSCYCCCCLCWLRGLKKTDKGLNLIAVRVKGWVKRQAVDKNRSLSEIKVISAKGSHRPDWNGLMAKMKRTSIKAIIQCHKIIIIIL